MQLFITPVNICGTRLNITEERVIFQCEKVLRYSRGSIFFVQWNLMRYQVKLISLDKKVLVVEIINEEKLETLSCSVTMIVAIPNKIEKAELIVQKLSEIGVAKIIFRPAMRSQLRMISEKKMKRLDMIALEATEQARGTQVPQISCVQKLDTTFFLDTCCVVFDTAANPKPSFSGYSSGSLTGIIGPEGGLDLRDYQDFGNMYSIHSLGKNVLRMETASIIAARFLQQFLFGTSSRVY